MPGVLPGLDFLVHDRHDAHLDGLAREFDPRPQPELRTDKVGRFRPLVREDNGQTDFADFSRVAIEFRPVDRLFTKPLF